MITDVLQWVAIVGLYIWLGFLVRELNRRARSGGDRR